MPNAAAHKTGAAITVGLITAAATYKQDNAFVKTATASALAHFMGTLPDLLEPATNPNHRQCFHSLAFLGLVGAGMYKLYRWETEDEIDKLIRFALLATGGAYVTHLLMDSTTPKGLPIL